MIGVERIDEVRGCDAEQSISFVDTTAYFIIYFCCIVKHEILIHHTDGKTPPRTIKQDEAEDRPTCQVRQ